MIRGVVNDRLEAIIRLQVLSSDGVVVEIDAIPDTGFTGSLTLPNSLVLSLELIQPAGGNANLADGSTRSFGMYAAQVEWDGSMREVLVSALGQEALLGMRLLADYDVRIEVRNGGAVAHVKF